MNKLKLLFIFLFALNIFGALFCMENGQDNGRRRGRGKIETLEDEQDLNAPKRKKEGASDSRIESMETESVDSDEEQEDLVGAEFWDDLFGEKLEKIKSVVADLLKKDPNFDDCNDFYDAFKNFGSKGVHDKCVDVLKLFLDKDLDWLRLFNIVLYDKNKQAMLLLKNKVVNKEKGINKINEFQEVALFAQEDMAFLPGNGDNWEISGYFRPLSPLFIAICLQDLDLVKFLVEKFEEFEEFGADTNAAQVAPENYTGPEIYTGMTPLQVALILGDDKIIDCLFYNGADLDVNMVKYLFSKKLINSKYTDKLGRTLLHIACERSNIDLAKYLISLGADLDAKDNRGVTPIGLAMGYNFQEVFSHAFDSKIFDIEKNGRHFLNEAICWNCIEMVKYFIEKVGINLNFVDVNGNNWLHIACWKRSYDVALYLEKKFIEKSIDVNIANKAGFTPLDIIIANKSFQPELIYKLVMNGKRDANNKILIPDSLKNSQVRVYRMLCKILVLFPSVYCDSVYLDNLYRDCEKPKDALSGLILILNSYGELIDYYLKFANLVLEVQEPVITVHQILTK